MEEEQEDPYHLFDVSSYEDLAIPTAISVLTSIPSSPGAQDCRLSRSIDACVYLNVYHLDTTWQRTNKVSGQVLGIGGAYHAGVEVYGIEWTFGADGVDFGSPRSHPRHIYQESILMGETSFLPGDVEKIIERMSVEWRGDDYELLEHNCCSFADALCEELVGESIPSWVDRFPILASAAAAKLDQVVDLRRIAQGLDQFELGGDSPSTTACSTPRPTPRAQQCSHFLTCM